MNEKEITVLLNKADELRSLFVLGQRVIPFLEEIFVFVRDIQPVFEEINESINENLKKMPGASEKLSKVTEANEIATSEIMDILDKVFQKTSDVESNNHKIKANYEKIAKKPIRLLEIIHKGIEQGSDLTGILPQLAQAINKLKGFSTLEIEKIEHENNEIIQSLNNDASSIMMSLQVQDITSQQLAAVDHMLHTVQNKLGTILAKFQKTDITKIADDEDVNITKFHRDIAFDPNAISSIEKQADRQHDIDEMIQKRDEAGDDFSADDIDAMFSSGDHLLEDDVESAEETTEEESKDLTDDNIDAIFSEESNEDLNESVDIDAMFASNSSDDEATSIEEAAEDLDEPIDPDDIDAMFASNSSDDEATSIEEAAEDLDEPIDPDDIDAMFASNSSDDEATDETEEEGLDEPIDPDDIEAMFSK